MVIRLPDSVQQSLKHRHSPALRFSLVFEGQQRRHIATCHLVDDNCIVSVIPEHKSCKESVRLFLYLHEPVGCRLILQREFLFTATDPFDIVASTLISLAVRSDINFPLTWQALISCVDDGCLPCDWSRDRLLASIDSLRSSSDQRLSASLLRVGAAGDKKLVEQFLSVCKADKSPFDGRSTVLHFLAAHGLIASSSVLLRHFGSEGVWTVKNESEELPGDLADRAGFSEFGLLLRCPQSIRKWVVTSTEAQLRVTSGESVASIAHPSYHTVVMTTNKEKSGLEIEQDVHIHKAVEDSEAEAYANAQRRAALNGGPLESPSSERMEAEELERFTAGADNLVFEEESGESSTDIRMDDERLQTSGSRLVHSSDTIDFAPLGPGTDHPPGSPLCIRSSPRTPTDGEKTPTPDNQLSGCTNEELVDPAEPTWSCTLTKEGRGRYTKKYIKRQDLIWEMIATERNYIRMLIAIREVYRDPFLQEFVRTDQFPPETRVFTEAQAERLFPCVDRLSTIHGNFLHRLLEQQGLREDRAIHELGDVLLAQFQGKQGEEMVKAYGEFYAKHLQGKRLVVELKQNQRFAAFLSRCYSDQRIKRRTLDDIYLIINQRFSKLESLLIAIIENTINQAEEAEKITRAKDQLKDITFRAEAMLGESQNKEMLVSILENFDKKSVTARFLHQEYRLEDLSSDQRSILHYGKLRVFRSGMRSPRDIRDAKGIPICKLGMTECLGILFTDMFVLLQETRREDGHGKKYTFLKEDSLAPSVLPFAYLSSFIVRDSPRKHEGDYEFFVIFNYENVSCRYSIYTNLPDERTKWGKLLSDAAMNTELPKEKSEDSVNDRSEIDEKYKTGCQILEDMRNTDIEIEHSIAIKTSLWLGYLDTWGMSSLAEPSETHEQGKVESEELPNVEDIEGMMKDGEDICLDVVDIEKMTKLFSREATKLHMLIHSCNTNLTRSASSAADQTYAAGMSAGRGSSALGRRTGGIGGNLPRRHETFAGYDGKMQAGMYGKRPSLENANSDESVGTMDKPTTPINSKSETSLKVKDSSRRRSSVNISNLLSKFTKSSSDKSHSDSKASNPPPMSPTSPTTSTGTPTSPAETTTPSRLSSHWDWSNEYLEGSARTPNRSVVQSLSTLNSETRRLIITLSRLRTRLTTMDNESKREAKSAQQASTPAPTPQSEHGFHNMMRETEKLRNQRAELDREKAEFMKQKQKDSAKLETEREDLLMKQEELKKERERIQEAKEKLVKEQEVLQTQIRLHQEKMNENVTPKVSEKDLLYPEVSPRQVTNSLRRDSGGPRNSKTGSIPQLSLSASTGSRGDTVNPSLQHQSLPLARSYSDLPVLGLPMSLADKKDGAEDSKKSKSSSGGKSKSSKRGTIFNNKKKS